MARLNINQPAVVGDNRPYQPQPYSSRAVDAAPATAMEYFKSTTSSSQSILSPLAQLHPSLLPLLSYYLSRHYAQQAEISPFKQAPIAFRNPRSLRQTNQNSRSSNRNRLRNSSNPSQPSKPFQHILHNMAKRKSQPSEAFHMTTRKRAKTTHEPADSSTPAGGDVDALVSDSSQTSSLSSVTSQESVPERFEAVVRPDTAQPRRSNRKRLRDEVADPKPVLKKQKISSQEQFARSQVANLEQAPEQQAISGPAEEVTNLEHISEQQSTPDQAGRVANLDRLVQTPGPPDPSGHLVPTSPTSRYPQVASEAPRQYFSRRYWPNLHTRNGLGPRKAPVYYSADTTARHVGRFRDEFQRADEAEYARETRQARDDARAEKLEAEEAENAADSEKLEILEVLKAIAAAAVDLTTAPPQSGSVDNAVDAAITPDAVAISNGAASIGRPDIATDAVDTASDLNQPNDNAEAVDAGDTESQESPRESTPHKRTFRGGGKGSRGKGKALQTRGPRPGRGRGKRGGDESPEPPQRARNLTPETEDLIKKLRARQAELKRFFHTVGSQQTDLLDLMATRDTQKLLKKAKAHKNVPEYETIVSELNVRMEATQQGIRDDYEFKVQYEKDMLKKRKEVQDQQDQVHYRNIRAEHLQGAQGDIALLKKAHAADMDDTRTEDGSDLGFFPRYHEMPEPDTRVRGYSSKIFDEKPLREALESYDVQDVIDEEILVPLRKELEEQNRKHEEEIKAKFLRDHKSMKDLSDECIKQLDQIKGYLIPKPIEPREFSAFSLSALADLAEWVATNHPQKAYQYVPLAPGDAFPPEALEFGPLPGTGRRLAPALGHIQPPLAPPPRGSTPARNPRRRRKSPVAASPLRPQLNLQTSMNGNHPLGSVPTTPTPLLPAPVVSSGPGQPIAPAPPKRIASTTPAPPATFRHSAYSIPPGSRAIPSPSPHSGGPPQQYVFQPPQQPQVHQPSAGAWGVPAGPRPPPSAGSPGPGTTTSVPVQSPFSSGPSPGGFGGFNASQSQSGAATVASHHQGKIPVQFINSTPTSTKQKADKKAERRRLEEEERGRKRGVEREREDGEGMGGGQGEAGGQRLLLPKP